MMPNNAYLWETAVKVLHIAFQRLTLCFGTRVLRLPCFITATHIHYVPTHAVISCCTVGNFPWVNLRILVVIYQSFHASVQVNHIRVTHLLPATTTLAYWVGVPVAYLCRAYLTAFRRGGAVDYKILYRLTHRLQDWS